MKDLRDTFASQLLTCGVQLGYVSRQLGHSKPTVTADHYAKWLPTQTGERVSGYHMVIINLLQNQDL